MYSKPTGEKKKTIRRQTKKKKTAEYKENIRGETIPAEYNQLKQWLRKKKQTNKRLNPRVERKTHRQNMDQ